MFSYLHARSSSFMSCEHGYVSVCAYKEAALKDRQINANPKRAPRIQKVHVL